MGWPTRLLYSTLYLFTWPYYATFVRYTLEPLQRIAGPQKDLIELSQCVQDFALGKAAELKYIGFAATINAGLTVATFSWPRLEGAPWAAPALLYAALFFTIGALVTGSQHIMFFHKMCPYQTESIADEPCYSTKHNIYQTARAQFMDARSSWSAIFNLETGADDINIPEEKYTKSLLEERGLNPSMILTWQCPIMLMAWSWVGYLVAIVVLIARPFIGEANRDTDEHKTAIFSLTFGAFMFLAFLWSSWFIYQASRTFKIISPRARLLPS